ncbi:MAG: heme-binding protein [Gammaproteobacteria bacterium]|nr:heme-binding protein [Gammaproteobacteria bacterium]
MSTHCRITTIGRALLLAGLLFPAENAISLEKPEYTVLSRHGDIEYRQYEPYLVAETVIEKAANPREAGKEGFYRLLRYITGGNQSQTRIPAAAPAEMIPTNDSSSKEISMPLPVQQYDLMDSWCVTFMIPSQYSLDTVPVPTDPRVRVREVPGRLMAALRYSGRWTERNFINKKSLLLGAIEAESVTSIGNVRFAFYNPPYTFPFMRRNEVMVEVTGLPAVATGLALFTY